MSWELSASGSGREEESMEDDWELPELPEFEF